MVKRIERTLIIIKPDGVKRDLTQEIIKRIESINLKIKFKNELIPSEDILKKHYPNDEDYLISIGMKNKSVGNDKERAKQLGLMVVNNLRFYLQDKIVVMLIEGESAVEVVRKLAGNTDTAKAQEGTIRGDFAKDSIEKANKEMRAVRNILHASSSVEDAEKEIGLWFG